MKRERGREEEGSDTLLNTSRVKRLREVRMEGGLGLPLRSVWWQQRTGESGILYVFCKSVRLRCSGQRPLLF